MAGRHGKFLYQRSGSPNWYLRLVFPPELRTIHKAKRVEVSLGTANRDEALVKALPRIQQHKQELLMVRSMMRQQNMATEFVHQPGREYPQANGSKIVATSAQLIHIDAGGSVTKIEPNQPREKTIWQTRPEEARALGVPDERAATMVFAKPAKVKPAAEGPDPDLQLLEDFLELQTRTKHYEADARRTWARWKEFVGGRSLSKCNRADGQGFIRHLKAQNPPPAPVTLRKWISLLKAPISHGLPRHDPRQDVFHKLIGKTRVQTKRIPLSEADMELFRKEALPHVGPEERLMWVLMATTGMRPNECANIHEEFEESGIRYLMLGVGERTKTETSARRIPLPEAVLQEPDLPSTITGRLFAKNHVIILKNLNRTLRRIGIADKRKVVYSLRHRAHDRLRAALCPRDIQLQIVGHDEATIHDDYGKGHPINILKQWIEVIGY
ncbi:putative integrase [Methylorubrum extorquens DM4]|uniref:Integrase n=1 Tax=Methylorubrum extorquens (strain DSM 6343 / CIP 106787 / DM4) TaxID=661410 RepID=C7CBI1_METED|nr:DUF6538 domain-containing protein [Methylorubrum extorquens]CAX22351.1 putative integrase [Methylorubrum extorquens DM4]